MGFFKIGNPASETGLEEEGEGVKSEKSCVLYLLLGKPQRTLARQ